MSELLRESKRGREAGKGGGRDGDREGGRGCNVCSRFQCAHAATTTDP